MYVGQPCSHPVARCRKHLGSTSKVLGFGPPLHCLCQEPVPVEQLIQNICDLKQGYTQFGGRPALLADTGTRCCTGGLGVARGLDRKGVRDEVWRSGRHERRETSVYPTGRGRGVIWRVCSSLVPNRLPCGKPPSSCCMNKSGIQNTCQISCTLPHAVCPLSAPAEHPQQTACRLEARDCAWEESALAGCRSGRCLAGPLRAPLLTDWAVRLSKHER